MCLPEVEISPEDSIQEACAKVTAAYERRGASVLAFEHLNTLLPISAFCRFFQIELGGERCVAVVTAEPWEENSVLAALNVLLNIRMDPEPPGLPPRFRFYGAYPVAPVLATLFGDTPSCQFECRAALVVGYATDLRPSQSYQLAAVAVHLLRECFGVRTRVGDPAGDALLEEIMPRWFSAESFPEGGAPLNAVVTLGFLYGEVIRARLPYLSRWVKIKEHSPWPVLALGPCPASAPASGREGAEVEEGGSSQIVFNPLATVVSVYQGSPPSLLRESLESLTRKCEDVLGTCDEN